MHLQFDRGGSGGFLCPPSARDSCDPNERYTYRHLDPAVDPNTGLPYKTVDVTQYGPLPMVVLVWGQPANIDGLSLAFGVLPPSSVGIAPFRPTGSQRYTIRSAKAVSLQVRVGAAYELAPGLRIGFTVLNAMTQVTSQRAARSALNPEEVENNESLDGDHNFEVSVIDYFSPAGTIGVLYAPWRQLELGINVRTPVVVIADGDLSLAAADDAPNTSLSGAELTFRQKSPWALRTGVRYVRPRFDIELDYVLENWGDTGTCLVGPATQIEKFGRTRCGDGLEVDVLPLGAKGGVIGLARDRATGEPMAGVQVIATDVLTNAKIRCLSEDELSFNSSSTGSSGMFIVVDLRAASDSLTADIGNGEIADVDGTAGSTNDALFVMVLNVPAC